MRVARALVASCIVIAVIACGDRSSLLTGQRVGTPSPTGGGTADAGRDGSRASDATTCPPDICPIVLAIGGHPYAIAVSASHVYWTDEAADPGGSVDRVPIGGGATVTIAKTVGTARAIAVDTRSVYWTDSGTSAKKRDGAVMSAPLIGGKPKTLRSRQVYPTALALDGRVLYWGSSSDAGFALGVGCMDIVSGESLPAIARGTFPTSGLVALDDDVFAGFAPPSVDSERTSSLALLNQDALVIGGANAPTSVAADLTRAYATVSGDAASSGTVIAVPYSTRTSLVPDAYAQGTFGTPTTLAAGQNNPDGIAIDASGTYWTTGALDGSAADGTVEWLAPGATASVSLASHQSAPHRVALDGTNVYWTNGGAAGAPGSVMQLAKRSACTGAACACPSGETMCATGCVDTSIDLGNCGGCGAVCDGGPAGPGFCGAGRCIVTLEAGNVSGATVVGSTLYWTGDEVFSMAVTGGTVTTVAIDNAATVIAADSAGAVWLSPVPSLEGTGGVTILVPEQSGTTLAIDPTYAYWGNPLTYEIDRIPRTGGAPSPILSGVTVLGLARAGANIYWSGSLCSSPSTCTATGVFHVPTAGGALSTIALSPSGDVGLGAVAVDASSVYWVDEDAIIKAPLSGGTPVTLVTQLAQPSCLAVDATYVYAGLQGSIVKVPLSGGSAELVAPAIAGPIAITLDATSVYWVDNPAVNAAPFANPRAFATLQTTTK